MNCSQWDLEPPSQEFRASSGGIFADMGVHEFDQIRWLTGQEIVSMHAARTAGDDPDCVQIVAELDGGSTAMISLGRWHPQGDSVKVEVYGTKGTASCWFLQPVGGEAAFHQALRLQAEDFARLVRTGKGHGARPGRRDRGAESRRGSETERHMIKIGNAPVSYGAFEVTVGKHEGVPSATEVLDAVQAAGYQGIDLGPLGYLGLGADLARALHSRDLLLTGGYVEIDVGTPDLTELGQVCDAFDAVAGGDKLFLPRPTIALVGGEGDIAAVVGDVVTYCAGRGYEAVLHNEVGTQISGQDAVIRALETTDAKLCLDTGHLVAAGGDPLAILANWRDRVSHVHLKDSSSAGPFTDAMQLWENDVFCRLGEGVGRVGEVVDALVAGGYEGWIIVEHDVLPTSPQRYRQASDDQWRNRQYLRERGV